MADIIRTQIVIIGAGFGGIGMAIRLKQSGITDFIMLERDQKIGGTWRDNTYPGAACDVSSHLYSFSFEPNPDWSRMFSPHHEIQDYMYHCYNKYNLAPFTHLGENVDSMAFDDNQAVWIVHTASGKQYHAQFLVNAMGPLNRAVTPNIKGLGNFKGTTFHSSHWNHTCDLKDKKVAVIGTGASAIQIVPNIVNEVKELHLFQRTAPWIIPKRDRAMKDWEKRLFRTLPFTQRWLRNKVYLINELTAIGMVINPGILKVLEKLALLFLKKSVPNEALRKKVTPNFSIGCKRILLSNEYYPAICKSHVEVITDGIEEIKDNSIITKDGKETAVDAIIFATGFNAAEYPKELIVKGSKGIVLGDVWESGPEAYLGTAVHGFPNMFLVIGPNTGLGHNSMVFMIESQIEYILQSIQLLNKAGKKKIEVKQTVQDEYNKTLQEKLKNTIWNSGCKSWYTTSTGKNTSIWPGFTFQFWWKVKHLKASDFVVE